MDRDRCAYKINLHHDGSLQNSRLKTNHRKIGLVAERIGTVFRWNLITSA
jgi:hypothetical protein